MPFQKAGAFSLKRSVPLLPAPEEQLRALVSRLTGIEAIGEAHIDHRGRLSVRYDASCVGLKDIERLIDEAGIKLRVSAWWRIKSAWYRFVDANARSNALSSGGACCSRPPSPWGASRDAERDT